MAPVAVPLGTAAHFVLLPAATDAAHFVLLPAALNAAVQLISLFSALSQGISSCPAGHWVFERPQASECGADPRKVWHRHPGECEGAEQAAPVVQSAEPLQGEHVPCGGAPHQPEAVPGAPGQALEGVPGLSCNGMSRSLALLVAT